MATTYYTEDHEWLSVEGDVATVGITQHAQEQLGDIVYVELPEPGRTVAAKEDVAVVESVKAASEIYAPVSGEIIEGNSEISDNPGSVNEDPEGAAWFFKIRVANADELASLMNADAYKALVETLA